METQVKRAKTTTPNDLKKGDIVLFDGFEYKNGKYTHLPDAIKAVFLRLEPTKSGKRVKVIFECGMTQRSNGAIGYNTTLDK